MTNFRLLLIGDADEWQQIYVKDFLKANVDGLTREDAVHIAALRVGDAYHGGGGASPQWWVIRVGRVFT
jgi:hypothetical protein